MLLVNYNDKDWIERFITEVLTDEDLLELFNSKNFRLSLADKLGYTKIGNSYAFHNQDSEIEEDYNMRKLIKNIENNEVFTARFLDRAKRAVKESKETEISH